MKKGETDLQKGTDCSKGAEIAGRELLPGKMSTVARKCSQDGRENEMIIEKQNMGSVGLNKLKNYMDDTPKSNETEMAGKGKLGKLKRWKSQARSQAIKEDKKNGSVSLKRPMETQGRLSPECKAWPYRFSSGKVKALTFFSHSDGGGGNRV